MSTEWTDKGKGDGAKTEDGRSSDDKESFLDINLFSL